MSTTSKPFPAFPFAWAALAMTVVAVALFGTGCGGSEDEADVEQAQGATDQDALPSFLSGQNGRDEPVTNDDSKPDDSGDPVLRPRPEPSDPNGFGEAGDLDEPIEEGPADPADSDDDGWSAYIKDFPEPPAGLDGGGAATAEKVTKRYLTFLCTGDLNLYVSAVHPDWLTEIDEADLREMRQIMIEFGFPTHFEIIGVYHAPEQVGERYAAASFRLHFPNDESQRATLWLENIGDDDQPRWVYSERPSRE